jgi:hypothetical protein
MAATASHPLQKAMFFRALSFLWLISSFWHLGLVNLTMFNLLILASFPPNNKSYPQIFQIESRVVYKVHLGGFFIKSRPLIIGLGLVEKSLVSV